MNQQIAFQTSEKTKLYYVREIKYCQGNKNYCTVYLKDNTEITVNERLGKIEKKLNAPKFFRCHKSYIVNMQSIIEYNHSKNIIVLERGSEIPLANRKRCIFLKMIKNLHIAIGGGVIVRFKLHKRSQKRMVA